MLSHSRTIDLASGLIPWIDSKRSNPRMMEVKVLWIRGNVRWLTGVLPQAPRCAIDWIHLMRFVAQHIKWSYRNWKVFLQTPLVLLRSLIAPIISTVRTQPKPAVRQGTWLPDKPFLQLVVFVSVAIHIPTKKNCCNREPEGGGGLVSTPPDRNFLLEGCWENGSINFYKFPRLSLSFNHPFPTRYAPTN
jgi:hypothetical protein